MTDNIAESTNVGKNDENSARDRDKLSFLPAENVVFSDAQLLGITNDILNYCQLQPRFQNVQDIQENVSSICVAVLERLLHQKLSS